MLPTSYLNQIKAHESEADAVDKQSMRKPNGEVQRKDHSKYNEPTPDLNQIKAHESEADAVDRQSMRKPNGEMQRKDDSKYGVGIKHSLVILGSGIKSISHFTLESLAYLNAEHRILYLVNEPILKAWLLQKAPHAESLDDLYYRYPLRLHCYEAITQYILETLADSPKVAVVLYGHPTVFAKPALDAAQEARKKGYNVKILPGISAEDCLFADIGIDPGTVGCQSFEATDFLVRMRPFDASSYLILWQVGVIGCLEHPQNHNNQNGLNVLQEYLLQTYPSTHPVTLYEAAQYPTLNPRLTTIELQNIAQAQTNALTTLYVPPLDHRPINTEMAKRLKLSL